MDQEEDKTEHIVVVNDEEQYSIWPFNREIPTGWRRVGEPGEKKRCLDSIEEIWTDMRPRSLREAMDKDKASD